ncbi:MAG TPA: hypothetical protein VGA37_08855 [Gemmatimonadales bacterium]
MPVTARLSKRFDDQFGDEVANDLVDWFNQVDATYRSDLRELNEMNFARFDAKLEQRLAEARGDLRAEIRDLRVEMRELKADLIKWMFVFWAGTTFTVLGAVFAIVRL